MILVTEEDFSVDDALREIRSRRTGAIVSFVGVVREEDRGRKIRKMERSRRREDISAER